MTSERPVTRKGKASAAQTRTAEHALLGLLADTAPGTAAMHGYDLLRKFADGALADIIRIEPGMLYHHLKSLASRELLVTTIEHQATRPDRQMHSITGAGRESLLEWLAEPVRATRELRLEFLVKLYLVERLDPKRIASLIHAQRHVIDRLIESLEQQRDALDPTNHDVDFRRKVHDLRIAQNQAARQWLDNLHPGS